MTTETFSFGKEYEVSVEMEIEEVPHFCSGIYCYDLSWNIYHNGVVKDSIYTNSVFTPERLKYIVATGVARIIDEWCEVNRASDTNIRCAFYVANRPLEGNEEYGMYKCRYGVSQYDVWESLPTRKHLMHSQSYDEGSEVWCFSLEFDPCYEENGWGEEIKKLYIPHYEDSYENVYDEIMRELKLEEEERRRKENDVDTLISEVLEDLL